VVFETAISVTVCLLVWADRLWRW